MRACAHSGQLMKQQIVMSRGSFSLALEIEFSLFIMICSFNRYTDAISKYESVMKTEPGVHEYTIRSKERICHCFSKVNCWLISRIVKLDIWNNNHKFFSHVYLQDEKPVEAIRVCSEVLQVEPDNVNALKDRAEAYLIEEMYDEGKSLRNLICNTSKLIYVQLVRLTSFCLEQVYLEMLVILEKWQRT